MKTLIPITDRNNNVIAAALKKINGRAKAHAFTEYDELKSVVSDAESRLVALGIPEAQQVGVVFRQQSGSRMASAYGSMAKTTVVEVTKEKSQWSLTGVDEAALGSGNNRPKHALILPKSLASYAENAPRALHVVVEGAEGQVPGNFSVPKIDKSISLDEIVAEEKAERELKQFEKEGYSIDWSTEDLYNGVTHNCWSAKYKGHDVGSLATQPETWSESEGSIVPDDAKVLAEFGGLDYFKKEFAAEIEIAKEAAAEQEQESDGVGESDREKISRMIASFDAPSAESQNEAEAGE